MDNHILTANYEKLSLRAAEAVAQQLEKKPSSCFGLPTGRSPIGCYRLLSTWSKEGKLDWSQAKCFALDEYLGAQANKTFRAFLEDHLFAHTNLPMDHRFTPLETDHYDQLIAACGGLDLTMIGIGRNGHIAFNEPGTKRQSWTHCTMLTESTLKANASFFAGVGNVPKRAITMGIETILASRQLILLACGEHKKDVLQKALHEEPNEALPASFLQEHANLLVLTDFL